MTRKFIERYYITTALRIAADGIECADVDGLKLSEIHDRVDNAFRVVLGDDAFNSIYDAQFSDDDETTGETVDDHETPKF